MSVQGREAEGGGRRPKRRPSNIHAPVRVASELQREFPVMDPRATEVLINLIRTESLIGNLLARRFRRYGLSLSGFNALVILRQSHSRLHPHEIADRLLGAPAPRSPPCSTPWKLGAMPRDSAARRTAGCR